MFIRGMEWVGMFVFLFFCFVSFRFVLFCFVSVVVIRLVISDMVVRWVVGVFGGCPGYSFLCYIKQHLKKVRLYCITAESFA